MSFTLGFHGAARTVTGSNYLLTNDDFRLVVDVGMFQGLKRLREMNWRKPAYDAASVDAVVLTHAHIDHIGMLPRLINNGFNGPVYCTQATADFAKLLLTDSARIQEEDARWANKKGYSKHKVAKPLYSEREAKKALEHLEVVPFGEELFVGGGMSVTWVQTGHILGSGSLHVKVDRGVYQRSIVFSGDIGRYSMPLHIDPKGRPGCDFLVCESTYGSRIHDTVLSLDDQLEHLVKPCIEDGGTVLIPAFAVGRTQQITLVLRQLMRAGRLKEVPIHLDSPMAVNATDIYSDHLSEIHLDKEVFDDGRDELFPENVHYHRSVDDSKQLNKLGGGRIIVSASGMLAGGRVLHHLSRLAPNPKNLIILAGYQAAGTRGRRLLDGESTVRIHGVDVPIKAKAASIHGLSGHGDREELLRWMDSGEDAPKRVFFTHGEPEAAWDLAVHTRARLGWKSDVPELDEVVDLDAIIA